MSEELFRQQAIEAKRQPWLGSVRLVTPVSQGVWTMAVLLMGMAIALWLCVGRYTRREHVAGMLVPQAGLVDITSRSAGTVTALRVEEGAKVHAGDALLVISSERSSEALGDTDAHVTLHLRDQQNGLRDDIAGGEALARQQAAGLAQQRNMLEMQLRQLEAQTVIEQQQVSSYSGVLEKIRQLGAKGYASSMQIQQQESQVLDAQAQVKALLRQRYELQQQIGAVEDQLSQLPLSAKAKLNELGRQLAQNEQALEQNEADRSVVVRATQDGTVSALLIRAGQAVSSGQSLVAIVPDHSPLLAQLLVPSSAIGFIRKGTRVVLHYQAFPYQKFGVQRGTVIEVSRSALTPGELGALQQGASGEAMYRVQVRLDKQSIEAYGRQEALTAGMALDADLLLDSRRLIEWMFEPLYGMRRTGDSA